MAVLTSNERIRRLEDLGIQALRNRSFAKAEAIFLEELAMLNDFRYVDELTLSMVLSNLAITLAMQGKTSGADSLRKSSLALACSETHKRPYVASCSSLVVSAKEVVLSGVAS